MGTPEQRLEAIRAWLNGWPWSDDYELPHALYDCDEALRAMVRNLRTSNRQLVISGAGTPARPSEDPAVVEVKRLRDALLRYDVLAAMAHVEAALHLMRHPA
ncbi:MAG: hypothetical protein ACK5AZ_16265 [Bryobacteraceae bacterium]